MLYSRVAALIRVTLDSKGVAIVLIEAQRLLVKGLPGAQREFRGVGCKDANVDDEILLAAGRCGPS